MKRLLAAAFILTAMAAVSRAESYYGNVTISSSTVTPLCSFDIRRRGLTWFNNGSQTIYCGHNTSVTTSNGLPIPSSVGFETAGDDEGWRGGVYCLAAAGSAGVDVRYWWWTR